MSAFFAVSPRISYRASFQSLLCRRRTGNAVTNDVDGVAALGRLVIRLDLGGVDVGNAAQCQRERAALARACERLGLLRPQFQRDGLADNDVLPVLFLRRLV